MKILTNKKSLKIISIILIFSILLISIFPNYSMADEEDKEIVNEDNEAGGKLFRPIFQLFAGIGDLVMKTMQYYFYADFDIKNQEAQEFTFKYGPAAIFSGIVPGLDANFIKPSDEKAIVKGGDTETKEFGGGASTRQEAVDEYADEALLYVGLISANNASGNASGNTSGESTDISSYVEKLRNDKELTIEDYEIKYSSSTAMGETIHKLSVYKNGEQKEMFAGGNYNPNSIPEETCKSAINYVLKEIEKNSAMNENPTETNEYINKLKNGETVVAPDGSKVEVFSKVIAGIDGNSTYGIRATRVIDDQAQRTSTAKTLQKIISKWYKALRLIALVGLLSVLVYVGIRIIISSTGQEKAKYKKMIGDWLVALCILFILHYIMAFTMNIVEDILEIFNKDDSIISGRVVDETTGVITDPGTDVLLAYIRGEINTTKSYATMGGSLVIYLVLVIFTVIFTIHYLKRLVYLAFFTMIAPLIALTYPLDKIKDGQAQAFGMWIKEYVFNALMPVMHILLYYIFVGSAMDLAISNPLYALVCIGFMMPAEKFFRKMFGFDKATTSSQFGAAAGGAMVMNAINKISHAGGSSGSGGKGSKSGSGSSGGDSSPARISNRPDGGSPDQNSPNPDPLDNSNPNLGGGPNPLGARGENIQGTTKRPKFISRGTDGKLHTGVIKGAKNLGKQYFNTANARKGLKALGRGARKGLVGAAGAAALGTAGLAAGIASGDLSKVFQYTAAGAAGGFVGANKAGDKLTELEKKNRDIYNEGRLGTTEFKTRKAIQELQQDNDFNQLCKELGVNDSGDRKRLIRQFSNNGITDPEAIKKAVAAGADSDKVKNEADRNAGINYMIGAAKIRKQATSQGMSRKDVKELLEQRNVPDVDDALKLIYSM